MNTVTQDGEAVWGLARRVRNLLVEAIVLTASLGVLLVALKIGAMS